jgi:hypothetical protein
MGTTVNTGPAESNSIYNRNIIEYLPIASAVGGTSKMIKSRNIEHTATPAAAVRGAAARRRRAGCWCSVFIVLCFRDFQSFHFVCQIQRIFAAAETAAASCGRTTSVFGPKLR